jgi:nitrogen PTS system EIIA component
MHVKRKSIDMTWDMSMNLGDLMTPDTVTFALKAASKKQALEELANNAAPLTGVDPKELFNSLLQRERLGSTALGRGIAIPHVHVRGLNRIVCHFARLAKPVEFEAPDNQPVDLLFLLLSPEHASGDHLKALARISRLVRDTVTIDRLRSARDVEALRAILLPTPKAAPHAA